MVLRLQAQKSGNLKKTYIYCSGTLHEIENYFFLYSRLYYISQHFSFFFFLSFFLVFQIPFSALADFTVFFRCKHTSASSKNRKKPGFHKCYFFTLRRNTCLDKIISSVQHHRQCIIIIILFQTGCISLYKLYFLYLSLRILK